MAATVTTCSRNRVVERRKSAFASLSGGERQRLFLVLALLNRPRLVILDDLTQGLDPAARRDVWAAVAQLRDTGTTVLLVTHDMLIRFAPLAPVYQEVEGSSTGRRPLGPSA